MSKNKPLRGFSVPASVPMDGRVIYDYQISNLEGKLLTFVESMGFVESREKAVKDILKSILREALFMECPLVLGEHLNEALKKDSENGYGKGRNLNGNEPVV